VPGVPKVLGFLGVDAKPHDSSPQTQKATKHAASPQHEPNQHHQRAQHIPPTPTTHPPNRHHVGYKFQFVTLAGFHALNFSMFSLAKEYATRGMSAYADLQVG